MPSQLGCLYQMVLQGASGALVVLDNYLETLILYENKYIKKYESNV